MTAARSDALRTYRPTLPGKPGALGLSPASPLGDAPVPMRPGVVELGAPGWLIPAEPVVAGAGGAGDTPGLIMTPEGPTCPPLALVCAEAMVVAAIRDTATSAARVVRVCIKASIDGSGEQPSMLPRVPRRTTW